MPKQQPEMMEKFYFFNWKHELVTSGEFITLDRAKTIARSWNQDHKGYVTEVKYISNTRVVDRNTKTYYID